MNVTSTVATGREAATTAPAAAAKAPLVVYIFYEEAVCDIKASAVAKTTEKMGYLYAPTDADGSTVGWDSTLEKSLEMAFLTPNTLAGEDSWYCPRCKNFVTAETVRSLFRLPQCLVLSFRRFKQQGYRVMKNSAKIAFPDRLDLKPFLDADADKEQPSSYQLKGVLYHSGTLDYGHYTASAYVSPLQKWVHFNDSHATVTESKSPTRGNAYVLCYEREDVLVKRKQEANPEMDLARIISGGAQA